MRALSNPLKIALIYAAFGVTWILMSDKVTEWLFLGQPTWPLLQTAKGLLYIAVTAALVYWLVRRSSRETERSRAWYRVLFEMSPDAVFVIGPEKRFVDMNEVAVKRYGYSRQELMRMGPSDLAPAARRGEALARVGEALEGPVQFEWRHIAKTGEEFDVEIVARPVRRDGERFVLSTVRDMTEIKLAERAVRESEAHLRALSEASFEALFLSHDGICLGLNRTAEQMYRCTAEDAIGSRCVDWVVPEDRDDVARCMRDGAAGPYEGTAMRKDGTTFPAQIQGRMIQYQGRAVCVTAIRDITERKRAYEELRESEQRFRALFENAPIGTAVLDPEGRVVIANRALERMLGHSRERLRDRRLAEFTHPADLERYLRRYAELVAGQRDQYAAETRYLKADGELVWGSLRVNAVRDAEGQQPRFICMIENITDRMRIEEQLRYERRRLVGAIEGTRAGTWEWNVQSGETIFNARWAEMLGYTLDELAPVSIETWRRLAHPEDLPACEALLARHFSGELAYYDTACRMKHKLAYWVWVRERGRVMEWTPDGRPLRMYGTHVDITAQKMAESERERLLSAIAQSGETIVITDADGVLQYANPSYERTSGYTVREAIEHRWHIDTHGGQDQEFYDAIWRIVREGKVWQGRLISRRRDGKSYTEEATISPVCDQDGQIVSFVAVKRDITRELELEHQYRQAQKMEAVGQLAGGVAHDFNNLLQVINGNTHLAIEDLPPGTPTAEALQEVLNAGERAATLVSQLLSFSRRKIMHPVKLDLNAVIAELLKLVGRVIGENIRLDHIPGHQLARTFADRSMMEQLLMNLCVNARDAMPGGGRITIETENVFINGEYCENHTWAKPGRYVLLSVTDTGCGMGKETLAHIFEPFFTTKAVGKGTGLGLSTVYGIVRQHQGMINAYSELGAGTAFKIYLPAGEREARAVGTKIERTPAGGSETILVAEDEPMVRELTTKLLKSAGYTTVVAQDGSQAVRMYEENSDNIALLLLDVVMPNMGGREAYEQIRARGYQGPVLFSSGYSDNAIHTDFVLDDGLRLLQKPFSRDELLRAVREVLGE